MKYRTLGKTGMKVSVVGVGTWQFGGEWGRTFDDTDAEAIFNAARGTGINLIDTAECYGDHLSESLIGQAVLRDRDQWVIATKFGHKFHEPFKRDDVADPDAVRIQLEDSLRALRTDYVDLYQFHSLPDALFDTDGLWEMLLQQVDAGKVRHLGVSISAKNSQYQVDSTSRVGGETLQVIYNRLDRRPEDAIFPSCLNQNLGVLARVPLASGYLSGKYDTESKFSDRDVRAVWHKEDKRREQLTEAMRIKAEEVPPGMPMAQWALAWCLQHEAVTCVIPGCKSAEQVKANAAAADLEMVRDDHPQAYV